MARYKYKHTTPSTFSFSDGTSQHLTAGNEYDLPGENAFVQGLVLQDYLELIPEPAAKKEEEPAKPEAKNTNKSNQNK